MRAEYSNLVVQVEQRRNLVEESQRNLAQTRAAVTAATTSSLQSRVDRPDGGLRPVSPSRKMIGLGGLLGGILAGCGLVFLTAPIARDEDVPPARPLRGTTASQLPSVLTGGERRHRARTAEPVPAGSNGG